MGGYALNQLLRFGSTLIMTRLLAPEMFGVMAIALSVAVTLWMLSDLGLRQNIVQSRRGNDPAFLDTAWVFQIVRGFVLWLLAVLISVALYLANLAGIVPDDSVYASPELPLVIAVNSFSAAIAGFQSTRSATAERSFHQKRLVQIELASQLIGLLVMLVVGLATHSIWALVAGGLVTLLVSTTLSHIWMEGHPNRFRWEKEAFRELVGFGKWIFVSSAAFVLAVNGDRLLLGAFVEADVLGLYAIAALLVGAAQGALNKLFMTVSLPAFSEIARNEPARLREVYYKLRMPSDATLLFATGLLFAAGQAIVDLLFDPRYSAAGGMLQVLAFSLIAFRYGVAQQIYLALGMPRNLAAINIIRFLSLFVLVPPLYYVAGLNAAIWGIALHALACIPLIFYFNQRLGLNDFRREAAILFILPLGYLVGYALDMLMN